MLATVRQRVVADSSLTMQGTCRQLRMRKWLFEEIEELNACFAECVKRVFQEISVDMPVLHIMQDIVVEELLLDVHVSKLFVRTSRIFSLRRNRVFVCPCGSRWKAVRVSRTFPRNTFPTCMWRRRSAFPSAQKSSRLS